MAGITGLRPRGLCRDRALSEAWLAHFQSVNVGILGVRWLGGVWSGYICATTKRKGKSRILAREAKTAHGTVRTEPIAQQIEKGSTVETKPSLEAS
jgi:hypothetical protein